MINARLSARNAVTAPAAAAVAAQTPAVTVLAVRMAAVKKKNKTLVLPA